MYKVFKALQTERNTLYNPVAVERIVIKFVNIQNYSDFFVIFAANLSYGINRQYEWNIKKRTIS